MLSVFILCAGDGARWNNYIGVPKQFLRIGGETILDRMTRLTQVHGVSQPYCVTTPEPRVSSRSCRELIIASTCCLAETIWATRILWTQKNVFLLGDVFYSERAISTIMECKRPLSFFGRPWPSALVQCGHGEMFGLSFSASMAREIQEILVAGQLVKYNGGIGNLWNLYQLASGLPLGSSEFVFRLLVPIDDYTNDIDTPIDYLRRSSLYESIAKDERAAVLISSYGAVIQSRNYGLTPP